MKNKVQNKKQECLIQNIKESQTLDKKHKEIVKVFQNSKNNSSELYATSCSIQTELDNLNINRDNLSNEDLIKRVDLLNKKEDLENQIIEFENNYNEMDYYDRTGDLILEYYDSRDLLEKKKESRNILDFLGNKKIELSEKENNRAEIFEKYWQRIEGVRIKLDDGTKRIKYCNECNIEKILDYTISAYICTCCGDVEEIILDEDRLIKDYSPYRRLNHFREWLNQFQARQSPDINEDVYKDIINELNKNRIVDFTGLNKKRMKAILKKLGYNSYYEHAQYIINKLSNLPPPKITRDMEKIFIKMFIKIETPWLKYKQSDRKNFLSYSYVLYKFCELLELDHLLDCFTLHKAPDKLMENDEIWKKICSDLNWEFISSFK
jgi:hypothetical protein